MTEKIKLFMQLLFANKEEKKRINFILYLSDNLDLKYINFIEKMNNQSKINYLNDLYEYYLINKEVVSKLEFDMFNKNN